MKDPVKAEKQVFEEDFDALLTTEVTDAASKFIEELERV